MINKNVKVCIGIPTGQVAREPDFYDYVDMMGKPPDSLICRAHGQSPARNRNLIVSEAYKNKCTHILFLDDDMVFGPDILQKLLGHDLDVVGGLYLMREWPHKPLLFDKWMDDHARWMCLPPGQKGLIEVVATGMGCCLIKTEVFKKIDAPFFTLGDPEKDMWCDDITFFRRLYNAGVKIHVDLDVPLGHHTNVIVSPHYLNEQWMTTYSNAKEAYIAIPALVAAEESKKEEANEPAMA